MKLKVDHFKQHAEFFGKIFLILESQDGDLKEFFRHETSSWPPVLSSGGLLHTCAKSVLLKCLLNPTTSNFDYSYSDSESNKGETFSKCFEKVFFPRIVHEIGLARRLHIVWDRYNSMSVKENPRDKQLSATCDGFCKSSWGLANFFEEC